MTTPAPFSDRPVVFACGGEQLVGIVSLPATAGDVGVLVVVGGPQYRAGSHRQFVQLAQRLAGAGYPVLRFDHRGMGDSEGALRGFEHLDDDIAAAVDALLAAAPGLRRVVIWGLCDAASAALLYVDRRADPRIAGLCLLNPWVRSAATLAQTHVKHYYLRRLREREFWLKLLRGGLARKAVSDLAGNLRLAWSARRQRGADDNTAALPFARRMARAWTGFTGPILLVLSGQDYTAKEFVENCGGDPAWRDALRRSGLQRLDLADADHTLSTAADRRKMEEACVEWLHSIRGIVAERDSGIRSGPLMEKV